MHMTMKLLKANRDKLTSQQYRTLRGQCLAGDVDGAINGFYKLMRRMGEM